MRSSPDPSWHRTREQQIVAHVERLLDDSRLMIDTSRGRRAVPQFIRHVSRSDRATDVKRVMTEMNRPDRDLQEKLPRGETLEVTIQAARWIVLRQTIGKLRVVCMSPVKPLIAGESPPPVDSAEARKLLSQIPTDDATPTTVVLVSTSGFKLEAHELVERRPDRTVILAAPNDAGGWSVFGPVETKALVDLFDPEAENEKRQRVRAAIDSGKTELLTAGIASDKLAAKTQLPLQVVESELKSYAKENAGLAAKRLDGRVVLFREGTVPVAASAAEASGGGSAGMPLIDRIKSLFSRKGDNEKKVAFLSERRAALSQQRDRAYEELGALEQKDEELQKQFKAIGSPVTRRRITTQLVQLRKDIERRQQLIAVLNQQVNVVSTHLHNLELVRQGEKSELPDSDEIASDAAAAEEMLAQLQADNELADSVGAVAHTGMTDEEQKLYEELEAAAGGSETTTVSLETHEPEDVVIKPPAKQKSPSTPTPAPQRPAPRRSEPEAG